jgi:hypothetical protein
MKLTDEELARLDVMTAKANLTPTDVRLWPAPVLPGLGVPPTAAALVAYRRARLGRT